MEAYVLAAWPLTSDTVPPRAVHRSEERRLCVLLPRGVHTPCHCVSIVRVVIAVVHFRWCLSSHAERVRLERLYTAVVQESRDDEVCGRFSINVLNGVRPSSAQSFGDQLGPARGTTSKIEDSYDRGRPSSLRHVGRVVAVGRFRGSVTMRYASSWSPNFRTFCCQRCSAEPTNAVGPSAMDVLPFAELQSCWAIGESCSASSCAHAPCVSHDAARALSSEVTS